jgi:hypothetical protein
MRIPSLGPRIGRHSVGGAPRTVQGLHQKASEPFAERVFGRQGDQLAYCFPIQTASQFGVDSFLTGRQPGFFPNDPETVAHSVRCDVSQ